MITDEFRVCGTSLSRTSVDKGCGPLGPGRHSRLPVAFQAIVVSAKELDVVGVVGAPS